MQRTKIALSVGVSFALAVMLTENYRRQSESNRQLAEVQSALSRVSANAPVRNVSQPAPLAVSSEITGSETARRQHNLDEILTIGWKLIDQRNPRQAAQAVRIFREGLVNVDPNSPELYNGLGRASLIAGSPREAIRAWRKGLELAPSFSDMQSGIGWGYWWLNDPSRAKIAWERALSINPRSLDAWSAMAWIDLALGRFGEAKRGFQELVTSDPKRTTWATGLAMAQGGNNNENQIAQFFRLPPIDRFDRPLAVDPAQGAQKP